MTGNNALITGASRGIGRAIALEFAKQGINVAINYSANTEAAQSVMDELRQYPVKAMAFKADITNAQEVKEMVETIEKTFGSIDILINNAGITKDNLIMRMKEEEWDQVMDINLKGVFLCTKAVVRSMIKQKKGKIINISSVVGILGNPGQANYSASKAGVIGFTKSIAKELAGKGINVNAIAPGFIDTDMTSVLSEDIKNSIIERIPLKRFGCPKDIANLAVFLSSDQGSYITGQVISVDGGMAI